jgi:hypothetical protein
VTNKIISLHLVDETFSHHQQLQIKRVFNFSVLSNICQYGQNLPKLGTTTVSLSSLWQTQSKLRFPSAKISLLDVTGASEIKKVS